MEERSFRRVEIILMILSAMGACVAFIITGRQAVENIGKQHQHEQRMEFRKAQLTERLTTYRHACQIAGEIVNYAETGNTDLIRAMNEFEKIYWGEMGLIEDSSVVTTSKDLRFGCRDFQRSDKKEEAVNKLKQLAVDFTVACRKSSADGWDELLVK
jgi:hypothetical protein